MLLAASAPEVKPPYAAHQPSSLPCNYARKCSDELSRRCRLNVLFKELPCCHRRTAPACSRRHLWLNPLWHLAASDPSPFFIIPSLIFVNLLGCAPAPNLLDVLLPGDSVRFSLNCTFSSSPLLANWISTGYFVLVAQERKKKLLPRLWPTDTGQHYLLPLVDKLPSLTFKLLLTPKQHMHLLFFLLFLVMYLSIRIH
jgi:hypothetical protein